VSRRAPSAVAARVFPPLVLPSMALLLAAACGDEPPPPPWVPPSATTPVDDGAAPPLRGGPGVPATEPAAPEPLSAFRDDLLALQRGSRRDHVRMLVLGDSHTACDLWTGPLRRDLQARFGDGGPGFLHLGVAGARHDALKISQDGHTATEPKTPSSLDGIGDGVLGLGAVLARPTKKKLTLLVTPRAPIEGPLRWQVCARPGTVPSRVVVTPRGGAAVIRKFASKESGKPVIDHLATVTTHPHELTIQVEGDAALCGAIGEADAEKHPGLVLDAVGINGARAATFLTRDEGAFQEEVRRRAPSLVVVEVGGNEAAEEKTDPSVFADELGRLVERLRAAAPRASCLVVGPTEQVARPQRTAAISRVFGERAEKLGCAFSDAAEKLGGPGAMQRMMDEHPPRAAVDGIHLVSDGYRDLAKLTLEDLVRGLPTAP
jgi:lysophospholipase L1-like esterase